MVRRRLRRRPPAAIRNGRALMVSVAGYGFMALFVVVLGMLIGIKGVPGVLPLIAAVTIPLGVICSGVARLTRTRQLWSLALVVAWGGLIAVVLGYLIVTMGDRQSDPNTTFFAQLFLLSPFVLAVASVWHFLRGARWFDGTHESRLLPEESGARPITAPLTVVPETAPAAHVGDRHPGRDRRRGPGRSHRDHDRAVRAGGRRAPVAPLLTVQGLKKHFPIYGGIMRRQIGTVYAVDGVDFEIMPGETFAWSASPAAARRRSGAPSSSSRRPRTAGSCSTATSWPTSTPTTCGRCAAGCRSSSRTRSARSTPGCPSRTSSARACWRRA